MIALRCTVVLISTLLAGCGAPEKDTATAGASAHAAEQIRWKLVTAWPKSMPVLGTTPVRFAEMIGAMSNGRLEISVYGAGELVPAFGVFDAVSQGTAQMGYGASYYWRGKIPIAQIFTTVPFGMTAQETNAWLHYGGGLELWREVYAPHGLIPFPGGNSGVQMAGWFNREIRSVADLKGLKMRIPGLAGEVLQRAGGVAVNIPGGELFTSLQTGVIDATEWVGPYNDLALGFYDITKYYYYPGWHEPGGTTEIIANKSAFEGLPADLQAIVEVATRAVNQDMLDEYTARSNAALKVLVEEHGVQLRELPPDVIARFKEISNEVLKEAAATDALSKRVYDSYMAFYHDVAAYHRITEQAILDMR